MTYSYFAFYRFLSFKVLQRGEVGFGKREDRNVMCAVGNCAFISSGHSASTRHLCTSAILEELVCLFLEQYCIEASRLVSLLSSEGWLFKKYFWEAWGSISCHRDNERINEEGSSL